MTSIVSDLSRLVSFAFDDREAHLAGRDTLEVVPSQPELPLRPSRTLHSNCLRKSSTNACIMSSFEQLAELRFVPALVELFGIGDRDVALGGLGQQSIAGRDRPRRKRPTSTSSELAANTATNGNGSLQGRSLLTREGKRGWGHVARGHPKPMRLSLHSSSALRRVQAFMA